MNEANLAELATYRAPWLEEKLLREHIASTPDEAARLFDEVKKYLVLVDALPDREVPMFSRRIDEVWHELVLFTESYEAFGERFFGKFIDHAPHTLPVSTAIARPELAFDEFRARYEDLFGPLSTLWRDELALDADTRLIRVTFGKRISVELNAGKAEFVWWREPPVVLLRVDGRARDALQFMVDHDHFYIREIPGLKDEERLAICRPLVAASYLRVAP